MSWHLAVTPRNWQETAFQEWHRKKRGILSVVTGGGKTVFAFLCMEALRKNNSQQKFNIVVPTTALLDQWFVSLVNDLGVSESQIACYSGKERPKEPCEINLFVINTARDCAGPISESGTYALIVDECHRAGSPCNARSLEGVYNATLGLSATPEREYDDGFLEFVEPRLGPIFFTYLYEDAWNDGVICHFDLVNVRVPLLPDEEEKYRKFTVRAARESKRIEKGDGSEDVLKMILQRRSAVSQQAAHRIPITAKIVEEHRGTRAIVFHERVSDTRTIADVLSKRGHSTTEYHTRIAPAVRRHNLTLYRQGMFDVLVCCRALDEGMNVPETSIAVIASSTSSTRQRIQRLGRVLRPAPGKERATVYTLYATKSEERRLKKEASRLREISSVRWLQGGVERWQES